jgi:catechol 2,3-dioxygenase-like lactoylglutathione lyase family enzyme
MSLRNLPPRNPNSFFSSMRGHHAAVRVPDFEAEKRWFVEKLDFRVIHEWPYEDQHLAYVGPANDDGFYVEILGDGDPGPKPKERYADLSDSLRYAGFHHVCFQVDDVDAMVAELRRRGVTIVTESFVLPVIDRRLAFFADPFGNLFELAEVLA